MRYKKKEPLLSRQGKKKIQNKGMANDKKNLPAAPDSESGVSTETAARVETPKMYAVILLNDDYTPMDFVILILKRFFAKQDEEAVKIMLDVHQKGSGVAGIYHLEIAEMKMMQANQFAQLHQHPLKTSIEEVT